MRYEADTTPASYEEADRRGSITEFRNVFADLNPIYEIEIAGRCDWGLLVTIGELFRRYGGTLESLVMRHYHPKGELVTCRVRDGREPDIEHAIDHLRNAPGVSSLSVTHHLRAKSGS